MIEQGLPKTGDARKQGGTESGLGCRACPGFRENACRAGDIPQGNTRHSDLPHVGMSASTLRRDQHAAECDDTARDVSLELLIASLLSRIQTPSLLGQFRACLRSSLQFGLC